MWSRINGSCIVAFFVALVFPRFAPLCKKSPSGARPTTDDVERLIFLIKSAKRLNAVTVSEKSKVCVCSCVRVCVWMLRFWMQIARHVRCSRFTRIARPRSCAALQRRDACSVGFSWWDAWGQWHSKASGGGLCRALIVGPLRFQTKNFLKQSIEIWSFSLF